MPASILYKRVEYVQATLRVAKNSVPFFEYHITTALTHCDLTLTVVKSVLSLSDISRNAWNAALLHAGKADRSA